jgi:transposase
VQINLNIKIPGLEAVIIKKVDEFEGRLAIHVELPITSHKCSVCGEDTRKVHDYLILNIKYLKCFDGIRIV